MTREIAEIFLTLELQQKVGTLLHRQQYRHPAHVNHGVPVLALKVVFASLCDYIAWLCFAADAGSWFTVQVVLLH